MSERKAACAGVGQPEPAVLEDAGGARGQRAGAGCGRELRLLGLLGQEHQVCVNIMLTRLVLSAMTDVDSLL